MEDTRDKKIADAEGGESRGKEPPPHPDGSVVLPSADDVVDGTLNASGALSDKSETAEASPSPMTPTDAFKCVLPEFEGPLDLLLHLIGEHKLDILDIPIALITEKYLETLKAMRELDLDIAGEFLLMAATLAHLKSRTLLPAAEPDPEDADALEEDPREELVRRLLEYQKYKAAAEALGERSLLGRTVFTRKARAPLSARDAGDGGLVEVPVFKLVEILDKVMKARSPDPFHEVHLENFNLTATMERIVTMLQKAPRSSFLTLLGTARDRVSILMTFLAILEMCKMRLLGIVQEEDGGDIVITARDAAELSRAVALFKDDYQ